MFVGVMLLGTLYSKGTRDTNGSNLVLLEVSYNTFSSLVLETDFYYRATFIHVRI